RAGRLGDRGRPPRGDRGPDSRAGTGLPRAREGGGGVKVARTIAEVRDALAPLRERRIALVPTMGAYHAGHEALFAAAGGECDVVVVSLFVNAPQFGEAADLERYPRDEERDRAIAAEAGVDLLFAPSPSEMYPGGYQTWIDVAELGSTLEGASR